MTAPLKSFEPSAAILACRAEVFEVVRRHGPNLSAQEVLALFAHCTGVAIAAQDQRTMTSDMALALVMENIEQGNSAAIEQLLRQTGGSA